MLRIMVLIYLFLAFVSLDAQDRINEISYSGVYKGTPLFVQNPYSPIQKAYCIRQIIVNKKPIDIDYNRSALILDFNSFDKFSPVFIHIQYADSTCVPILLNPDAIRYHSVFGFEKVALNDSSIVWNTQGESEKSTYMIEEFHLGSWNPLESVTSKEVYGGSEYIFYPTFKEGTNKYRIKYESGDQILYSHEVEHVFYPEPITLKRVAKTLILSRAVEFVIYAKGNVEMLRGASKEIDISALDHGDYFIVLNEEQVESFRLNDPVKVRKPPKSNN